MRKPYKTDLTDAQWAIVEPLIPPAKAGGRPHSMDVREVLNALLYQPRAGRRRASPPHDPLPKSAVRGDFPR